MSRHRGGGCVLKATKSVLGCDQSVLYIFFTGQALCICASVTKLRMPWWADVWVQKIKSSWLTSVLKPGCANLSKSCFPENLSSLLCTIISNGQVLVSAVYTASCSVYACEDLHWYVCTHVDVSKIVHTANCSLCGVYASPIRLKISILIHICRCLKLYVQCSAAFFKTLNV